MMSGQLNSKTKLELTIKQWSHKTGYEAEKILKSFKLKTDQWWYFQLHLEIPPNNNLVELLLQLVYHQGPLIWCIKKHRKISTHS